MAVDRHDRVLDVEQPLSLVPTHNGAASAWTSARMRSLSMSGVATSTGIPRIPWASRRKAARSRSVLPGSSSARRSMSLPGSSWPRASDPNTRTRRTPCLRAASSRLRRCRRSARARGPSCPRTDVVAADAPVAGTARSSRRRPQAPNSRSRVGSVGSAAPVSYRARAGCEVPARSPTAAWESRAPARARRISRGRSCTTADYTSFGIRAETASGETDAISANRSRANAASAMPADTLAAMSSKRRPGGSGRSRKGAGVRRGQPRRGREPGASPESLATDLPREIPPGGRRSGRAGVRALERAGDWRALAVLSAVAAVGTERLASAARTAADRLVAAGVGDPPWSDELGSMRGRCAAVVRDEVFDDAVNVLVEFERAGHDPYVVGVLIDHNLGGIAKDLLVGPTLGEYKEGMSQIPEGVSGTGLLCFEERGLGEAAARCGEALWRTEHTLDPPVSDDFDSQVAAVAAHLGVLPDDGETYEPAEISDSQRQAALDGFLASPEAEPFRGRDDSVDLATLAIDYCADYVEGEGRPLRWSPVVVELFMTWFLPRRVVREGAFFERTVPEVLPAWVRYAGTARGIAEAATEEAVAAIAAFRDEMLALVDDESAWGPGKALAAAAREASVDLTDEAALEAFIADYNAGSRPEADRRPQPRLTDNCRRLLSSGEQS